MKQKKQKNEGRSCGSCPRLHVCNKLFCSVLVLSVVDMPRYLGPRLVVLVALGFHENGVIVVGVRLHQRDFKQIRARLALDLAGDAAGVAAPGEESDQHLAAGGAGNALLRRDCDG